MGKYLSQLDDPSKLKELSGEECKSLAREIRQFILDKTSEYGGHLASNLGVVELTLALYRVFRLPRDKVIWDVGHQSYTHKILSGRKENFDGLRQYGGISGFPRIDESPYDSFGTGHSSTSISAGLGIAQARDVKGEDFYVVSVIGDGALTGGMAYEGLNNASRMKRNFIIILNDNAMSISKNVGGISRYLNGIRSAKSYNWLKNAVVDNLRRVPILGPFLILKLKNTKDSIKQLLIPGMLFENMGITYLGPVNGHNQAEVEKVLREAKRINHAVLVHVLTKKGKGYKPAERNPEKFHGVSPFEKKSGRPKQEKTKENYTDVFSRTLVEIARERKDIVAITAAMPDGTGLCEFEKQYPKRFFDVGIAEQHAVTSAAGMASQGLHPVVAVYSSFLQRAYDQIVHDVCLQKLPVTFCIDRAGLVGSDGETHQGIFDYSYLSGIPNMTILAPKNAWELEAMLHFALSYPGPMAIRYPRGTAYQELSEFRQPLVYGKGELLFPGREIALLPVGSMVSTAYHIRTKLRERGLDPALVNMRFIKPIDTKMIDRLSGEGYRTLVTLEENVLSGGFSEAVENYVMERQLPLRVIPITLPDCYVEHGDVTKLRAGLHIDSDSIIERLKKKGIVS